MKNSRRGDLARTAHIVAWLAAAAFAAFASGAQAQDRYTLLVFGDSGTGRTAQHRVASAMAQACGELDCDAALVLGDLIYPRGVKSVDDPLFIDRFEEPYRVVGPFPFWMSPGNHDHKRDDSIEAEIAYSARSIRWSMPAAHYAVRGLPDWLHIYSLDTMPIAQGTAGPEQALAARDALCGRPGWRLLMGHHPVFSNGDHGNDDEVGRYLAELVRDCGVQAYFAGHDHHQEHISTGVFEQFVQGAAAKLRAVETVRYPPELDLAQRFARATFGFAIVAVTPSTMDVRFFDGTTGLAQEIYHCRATLVAHECLPPP